MIYEYECPKCAGVRTVERGINEPEEIYICAICNCDLRRKWSSPTIVFNASGFYSTDNKK